MSKMKCQCIQAMTVHHSTVMLILDFPSKYSLNCVLLRQKWTWTKSKDMAGICITEEVARSACEQPNHSCCDIKECSNYPHVHHYTCNMQCFLGLLETLNRDLRLENERGLVKDDLVNYVVVWANVSLYHRTLTSTWFTDHPRSRGLLISLTSSSQFLLPHSQGRYTD